MFKKSMFCVALASLVLATSCSQDDLQTAKFSQNTISPNVELGGQPISTFAAAKGKAVKSRAVETTITNLGSFTMNAFQDGETNYMKDVKYTSTDGSVWNTDAGTFYWPVEGNLHFYAYAPEQPGQAGTFKLDKDAQTLTDFVPNTAAADQKDFVYAKSTGNNKANGTTGIDIDFQHALSEVTIAAKNENTCTIEPVDFLPQMTFEEWKKSIETTVSNNKGANLMLPKGTSPTDEYIINKVRSFNIESKTPMDCMMFLVDLKKKINGEV